MVYGPTKKGNLFRMISAIDRGRFPPLPRLPAWRSMLHVRNFTQSVLFSLNRERVERAAYIVADETPYSVTAIYESLCKALGKKVPSWRVPLWVLKSAARCGDALASVTGHSFLLTSSTLRKLVAPANYSAAAMIREMGYQPTYSFAMAIPELIEFYRKHKTSC
jgi:nucleoside-diphosphate-sugar epimerase